jgi:hypothetical protein
MTEGIVRELCEIASWAERELKAESFDPGGHVYSGVCRYSWFVYLLTRFKTYTSYIECCLIILLKMMQCKL